MPSLFFRQMVRYCQIFKTIYSFKKKEIGTSWKMFQFLIKKIFFSILNQKGYHDSRQKRNTTILENVSNLVLKNLLVIFLFRALNFFNFTFESGEISLFTGGRRICFSYNQSVKNIF